jgi:acyl carrier protein
VADCLARSPGDVLPESRLITDLGADSLDFIDLIFTLEKRFGVQLRENDLNIVLRPDDSDGKAAPTAEFISSAAVSRLLPWLPELTTLPDLSRVRATDVWPLITVKALWRLVEQRLGASA